MADRIHIVVDEKGTRVIRVEAAKLGLNPSVITKFIEEAEIVALTRSNSHYVDCYLHPRATEETQLLAVADVCAKAVKAQRRS